DAVAGAVARGGAPPVARPLPRPHPRRAGAPPRSARGPRSPPDPHPPAAGPGAAGADPPRAAEPIIVLTIHRGPADPQFADELAALPAADDRPRPPSWKLSPWAVATYVLGGGLPDGTEITPKYIGSRRLIEIAIATLATDRALL